MECHSALNLTNRGMTMAITLVTDLHRQLRELEVQRAEIESKIEVLKDMLNAPKAREALEKSEELETRTEAAKQEIGPRQEVIRLRRKPYVWQWAVRILRELGRPTRLEELAEKIIAQGKEFGGDNPAGALSSHISQHQDVIGQKAGQAYLIEWPESMRGGDEGSQVHRRIEM